MRICARGQGVPPAELVYRPAESAICVLRSAKRRVPILQEHARLADVEVSPRPSSEYHSGSRLFHGTGALLDFHQEQDRLPEGFTCRAVETPSNSIAPYHQLPRPRPATREKMAPDSPGWEVTAFRAEPGWAKQASPNQGGSKLPHSKARLLECASLLAP